MNIILIGALYTQNYEQYPEPYICCHNKARQTNTIFRKIALKLYVLARAYLKNYHRYHSSSAIMALSWGKGK